MSKANAARQAKAWSQVEDLLRRDYENADLDAVRAVLACFVAHRIVDYPPVWVMVVAPSGSLKTAMLQTLDRLPSVHFVDEVTPNTFVSGRIPDREEDAEQEQRGRRRGKPEKREPASLLHRIGTDGYLVAADFSTILSMDQRNRARILAQLRRIYDGHFSRQFGTEENLNEREWRGRLTFLTAATPEIDRHHSVLRSLGERFAQVRMPRAAGVNAGLKAMRQRGNAARELKSAVQGLLQPLLQSKGLPAPLFPEDYETKVSHLGEFVALARAHVPRSRGYHEIEDQPCPEGNTRLPQEFAQIARGAATLAGRDMVCESDLALVRRVAFDCIPETRMKVMRALMEDKSGYSTRLAPVLVERTLEDMEVLGIAEKIGEAERSYKLTTQASALLEGAGITSPKMHMNVTGVDGITSQLGGSPAR